MVFNNNNKYIIKYRRIMVVYYTVCDTWKVNSGSDDVTFKIS